MVSLVLWFKFHYSDGIRTPGIYRDGVRYCSWCETQPLGEVGDEHGGQFNTSGYCATFPKRRTYGVTCGQRVSVTPKYSILVTLSSAPLQKSARTRTAGEPSYAVTSQDSVQSVLNAKKRIMTLKTVFLLRVSTVEEHSDATTLQDTVQSVLNAKKRIMTLKTVFLLCARTRTAGEPSRETTLQDTVEIVLNAKERIMTLKTVLPLRVSTAGEPSRETTLQDSVQCVLNVEKRIGILYAKQVNNISYFIARLR